MTRARLTVVLTLTLLLAAAHTIGADVRADQKTHVEFAGMLGRVVNIFGGKAAREGVTSTVAVKGNRKATLNDSTGQIVDLGEEKIYDLDLKHKSYKVTTFAQVRQRIEEAKKKAEEDARKAEGQAESKEPEPSDQKAPQVEVDFAIKNTGQKRAVNGFDTHEAVMTITVREKGRTLEQGGGLVLTSDMWLAPKIAAMKEVADFDLKYAQKLYGSVFSGVSAEQMASAMAMYPMMKDAIAKMNAEGGKVEGTAIQTTMTMEAVKSAEEIAEEAKAREDDSSAAPSGKGLGGMFGGLAKKIAQKKMAGGNGEAQPRTTFMTSTHEVLKVTTDVPAGDVAIPAGFKQK